MIALIKAVFEALAGIFAFFKDRQLIEAGKAEQKADTDEQAIKDIIDAARPSTDTERQRVQSLFRRD